MPPAIAPCANADMVPRPLESSRALSCQRESYYPLEKLGERSKLGNQHLVRYRRKGGVSDLRKARHFVELRAAISAESIDGMPAISMRAFIAANRIPVPHDARALLALEGLVHGWIDDPPAELLARIDDLIARQQGQ